MLLYYFILSDRIEEASRNADLLTLQFIGSRPSIDSKWSFVPNLATVMTIPGCPKCYGLWVYFIFPTSSQHRLFSYYTCLGQIYRKMCKNTTDVVVEVNRHFTNPTDVLYQGITGIYFVLD